MRLISITLSIIVFLTACSNLKTPNCFDIAESGSSIEGICEIEAYLNEYEGFAVFYKVQNFSERSSVRLSDLKYLDSVTMPQKIYIEGYYERLSDDTISIIRIRTTL